MLPNGLGAPRYFYEVKCWAPSGTTTWKNTHEPASMLLNFVAAMKEIDEKYDEVARRNKPETVADIVFAKMNVA